MPAIGMVASIVLVAERVSVSKVAADESQDGPEQLMGSLDSQTNRG